MKLQNGKIAVAIPGYPDYYALKEEKEVWSSRILKNGTIKEINLKQKDGCVGISLNGKPTKVAVSTLLKLAFSDIIPLSNSSSSPDVAKELIPETIEALPSEPRKEAIPIELIDPKDIDFETLDPETRYKIIELNLNDAFATGKNLKVWNDLYNKYRSDEPGFTSDEPIQKMIECEHCYGQGGFGHGYDDSRNLPVTCGYCDGTGKVKQEIPYQNTPTNTDVVFDKSKPIYSKKDMKQKEYKFPIDTIRRSIEDSGFDFNSINHNQLSTFLEERERYKKERKTL